MKRITIILISFFVYFSGKSQSSTTLVDTTLKYNVEHDVSLDTATRVYDNIKVVKPTVEVEKQQYNTLDKEAELSKISPKIVAYKISPPSKEPLFKNYIRAGFGNYVTPYGELYTMSGRNDAYQYGLHLKHKSSLNGPIDKKNSGQSVNTGDLFVNYKLSEKLSFGGDVFFNRDMIHYYGYDQNLESVDRDSIRQVYNTIDVGLNSTYKFNDDFTSKVGIGYRTTSSKFENKETDLSFSIDTYKKLNENKIGLEIDGFLSQYADSVSYSRNYFKLKPFYEFNLADFSLNFGLNVVFETDTLNGSKGSHFYPFIDFKYLLSEAMGLQVYGGIGGDMKRNTYRAFLEENLFLNNELFINNTNERLNIYLGAKTQLIPGLLADLGVEYKSMSNLHYFTNSFSDRSKFDIVYDDKEVKLFNVNIDLSYEVNKNLLIEFKNVFHSYSNFTPEKVIHRPNYEMDFITTYRIHDKIIIGLDAFYLGGLYAYDTEELAISKLDGIFDLNLNMEYRLNKRFSVFADVNNILSKQYQRYLYYNAKGINFLLGGTLSF